MQPLRCSPEHSPELKRKLKAGDGRAVAMALTVALARALELFLATSATEFVDLAFRKYKAPSSQIYSLSSQNYVSYTKSQEGELLETKIQCYVSQLNKPDLLQHDIL